MALVALVAACGSEQTPSPPAPPATLPAAALPQLEARERVLDRETLAEDAFEPQQLASVLEDAGYLVGREREFSGKSPTFDHVIARTLLFEDREGADAYLSWMNEHADEVLGKAEPAKIVTPGEAGATYKLVRCGTCKKELPTYLSAWRRGSTVLWLLAAGSGADSGFQGLADRFDSSRMSR
jgi:hypothetical protein